MIIIIQRYLKFTDDLTEIEFSWKESERAFRLYKEKQVSTDKSLCDWFQVENLFRQFVIPLLFFCEYGAGMPLSNWKTDFCIKQVREILNFTWKTVKSQRISLLALDHVWEGDPLLGKVILFLNFYSTKELISVAPLLALLPKDFS